MKPVLLVDDSPTVLLTLSALLADAGHPVETARSAEEALATLEELPPLKMMITDYHMPGRNGVDLIRAARRMSPYRRMPALLLTTESQQEKCSEARAAGACGWLVKPVAGERLVDLIRQLAPDD